MFGSLAEARSPRNLGGGPLARPWSRRWGHESRDKKTYRMPYCERPSTINAWTVKLLSLFWYCYHQPNKKSIKNDQDYSTSRKRVSPNSMLWYCTNPPILGSKLDFWQDQKWVEDQPVVPQHHDSIVLKGLGHWGDGQRQIKDSWLGCCVQQPFLVFFAGSKMLFGSFAVLGVGIPRCQDKLLQPDQCNIKSTDAVLNCPGCFTPVCLLA